METFKVEGRDVTVFPAGEENCPVIYLNTFMAEGARVYKEMQKMECPPFSLVAISKLDWNSDMAPWDIPPISKTDTPCTGGAKDYLKIMEEEIMPKAEEFTGKPLWRGITGYSLAGLFAVWAIYNTESFARVAGMSSSLWFPDFKEYVFTHEMKRRPECVFLSLGEKEDKTKNEYLKSVRKDSEDINAYYKGLGIDTTFVLNPGNHYMNSIKRTASGIEYILKR